ncbi:hypothetical protein BDFB_007159 [Asbolus verrucosus]|uniref:CCHC-type domain-containing protein n=1 Tax=Asbolus verrucosus TaxID=1661398 RepID=A0A482VVJ2_ASBVE|nr:hypothetical protein BDFB_007159 [Asbolus verrucosus]
MWRIKSCKTGKPTPLIRVITHQKNTIDHLLIHGISLFGRTYYAKASNAPTPTSIQCSRCFQFGHALADCPNKPIYPKCPNSHPPNKCPEATPSCPFCQGNHPAWSRSCPKFKKLTITDETPVLLTKIIDPPAEFADPVEPNDDDDSDNIFPTESILQEKQLVYFETFDNKKIIHRGKRHGGVVRSFFGTLQGLGKGMDGLQAQLNDLQQNGKKISACQATVRKKPKPD